jgi:hypothetical protein
MSIGMGYVFTDYYAQGASWKGDPYLLHLKLPPPGKKIDEVNGKAAKENMGSSFKAGNLRVPLTRAGDMDGINLVAPMWRPGDDVEEARVVDNIYRALLPSEDYIAENARMKVLDVSTKERFSHLL